MGLARDINSTNRLWFFSAWGRISSGGAVIAYDLECGNGHCFEGWFEDCESFDRQMAEKRIFCPVCDDGNIVKIPFAPAIRTKLQQQKRDPDLTDIIELRQRIVEYVDRHFENVGSQFATEALKIHYGVAEARNIRGVSTPQEEKLLENEGVSFFKVDLS